MLFNSWEFLWLLVITVVLYYLPFSRQRKLQQIVILLIASALFYAWEEPKLLILLGASCLLNAFAVERILYWKSKQKTSDLSRAKQWLCWTVALNLAFLAFFKYAGFLFHLFPDIIFPPLWKIWLTTIPLPIGISFYTFQGLSLVVDVWRGEISEETKERLSGQGAKRILSLRDTAFYISFFPQLVAGPIVKAHEFIDQIGAKRYADIDWLTVRRCLILGYFLKIVIADNLAEQTGVLTLGAAQLAASGPINLMSLLYGYSFQIFADFGGYSLIAIGLGALFGYKLPQNFNSPYLSTSITEFWRRWHLSLSSWLRDYLYIPLGGNRKGSGRTYFNLFLVMFLGGLWHGAAWKFALWGSLHGIFLAIERLAARRNRAKVAANSASVLETAIPHSSGIWSKSSTISILKWFITFHLVTALWLTFMMPDMASIAAFFRGVVSGNTEFSGPPIFSLAFYGSAIVLYHLWGWVNEQFPSLTKRMSHSSLEPLLHGLLIFIILTNPGAPRGFIYFQF